ncbi:hypothetical protein ACHAWF_015611 [Thalassiosira exigua]
MATKLQQGNEDITAADDGAVFYIGATYSTACYRPADPISEVFPLPPGCPSEKWPPVSFVVYKPCICTDGSCCFGQTYMDEDMEIPDSVLAASRLTREELRSLISDVAGELNKRKKCCWKFGWLGPLFIVAFLIDIFFRFAFSKTMCFKPTTKAINGILNHHNEKFTSRGVKVELVTIQTQVYKTLPWEASLVPPPDLNCWALAVYIKKRADEYTA